MTEDKTEVNLPLRFMALRAKASMRPWNHQAQPWKMMLAMTMMT